MLYVAVMEDTTTLPLPQRSTDEARGDSSTAPLSAPEAEDDGLDKYDVGCLACTD